jgi:hypothetical protein
MADNEMQYKLPSGRVLFLSTESLETETPADDSESKSTEGWFKTPFYGIESLSISQDAVDFNVNYSLEKFIGNKQDKGAPPAGKMRVKFLGMGSEVVFSDGTTAKNDVNAIFTSPYIKEKIKEFNDYYINQKGYQPFTQEDARTLKMDAAQILRKFYTFNFMNHVEIKIFDGTAIYGIFSHLLGKAIDKLLGSDGGSEGGPKNIFIRSLMNYGIPFCIVYTHTDEKGQKRVIARRFLVVGVFSKKITDKHAMKKSGGKEIGTVK